MSARPASNPGFLVGDRYRLDGVVHRSSTAIVHAATHRNGASVWLKLPTSPAHAAGIVREGTIANALGLAITVRDDGTGADGLPYLVLDPPESDSVAQLVVRASRGELVDEARAAAAGLRLLEALGTLHEHGLVLARLEPEDVLVLPNGDIGLFVLDGAKPRDPAAESREASAARDLLRALAGAIQHGALKTGLQAILASVGADVGALKDGWVVALQSAGVPSRPRMIARPSLADIPSVAPHDTPMAVSVPSGRSRAAAPPPSSPPPSPAPAPKESSIIGYLASHAPSVAPPPAPLPSAPVHSPLAQIPQMPRLVQATMERADARRVRSRMPVAAIAAGGAVSVLAVLLVFAVVRAPSETPAAVAALHASTSTPAAFELDDAPPATAAPAAKEAPPIGVAAARDAEAEAPIETPLATGRLRTSNAPAGRPISVDGVVVGVAPLDARVACGTRKLRVGAGASHNVRIPCGGERVIVYDQNGRFDVK